MRRIYAQGDLDGACFLYSIVNAYAALKHEGPDFAAVSRAFAQVDHPGDFLCGMVGTTGAYDKQYALLEKTITRVLALLGSGSFLVKRITGPFSLGMLEGLLGEHSVVILRYMGSSKFLSGMDHWVCAVDCDAGGQCAHVACSTRLQRACDGVACAYVETERESCRRWSNDMLLTDCDQANCDQTDCEQTDCDQTGREHTIVEGEVFQVTLLPG